MNFYLFFALAGTLCFIPVILLTIPIFKSIFIYTGTISDFKYEKNEIFDREEGTYHTKYDFFYSVDEKNYICNLVDISYNTFLDGELNEIYYNPRNPNDCMVEHVEVETLFFSFFMSIFAFTFGGIGYYYLFKTYKKIRDIKYLNYNGTLVKKLPYSFEDTNMSVNGYNIRKLIVEYRLPNGTVVKLAGDGRFDHKECDEDGLVDILIDLNDPSKFFIDFEINRLSGNLDSDFYKPTKEEMEKIEKIKENSYVKKVELDDSVRFNTNPFDKK